jgi:hypothetical protein
LLSFFSLKLAPFQAIFSLQRRVQGVVLSTTLFPSLIQRFLEVELMESSIAVILQAVVAAFPCVTDETSLWQVIQPKTTHELRTWTRAWTSGETQEHLVALVLYDWAKRFIPPAVATYRGNDALPLVGFLP